MHAPRRYPRCLQWLWIARKARFGQCGRRDRIARDACTELLLQSIVDVTQTIELQLHQEASACSGCRCRTDVRVLLKGKANAPTISQVFQTNQPGEHSMTDNVVVDLADTRQAPCQWKLPREQYLILRLIVEGRIGSRVQVRRIEDTPRGALPPKADRGLRKLPAGLVVFNPLLNRDSADVQ